MAAVQWTFCAINSDVDIHVTDGSDYQYDITFGWNAASRSPQSARWLDSTLRPALHNELHAMGHIPGAQHIPLDELPRRTGEVKRERPLAVVCASGYRSSIAASLLQREGFAGVMNVVGGTSAWVRAGYGVE